LKILLYFDWTGSRKDVKAWDEKVSNACEETGVTYMGLYGSQNEKWNFTALFDTESYDKFIEMARKVPRPSYMSHYITEILMKIKF
jgi:hypothetical protein